MKCTNCGNEIDDGAVFCTKCGNRINEIKEETNNIYSNNVQASITFLRKKKYYAVVFPIDVVIDDTIVGSLFVGDQITVPTTIGTHKLKLVFYLGSCVSNIEISSENPNIKITFDLGFRKPKIISIENL